MSVRSLVTGLWAVAMVGVSQEKAPVAYEVPPVFEVAGQLPPELIRGPHHRVRATAPSDGYLTHYTIDSDYGVFECVGRRELEQRIGEIEAIAKLVEVSKSDLFAEGLKRSIEQPIDAVKKIIKEPKESVKAVPSTVGHFFKKVGSSVGNTAKRVGQRIEDAGQGEVDTGEAFASAGKGLGEGAKSGAGFDQAKLDTARQLGVDPYSDNLRLQEEMEKVTWAFFAGGMPLRIAGAVTGAGIVVTATKAVGLPEDIYDVTPAELALRDREALEAMGAEAELIDAMINSRVLSVSKRHAIVGHLSKLPGRGVLKSWRSRRLWTKYGRWRFSSGPSRGWRSVTLSLPIPMCGHSVVCPRAWRRMARSKSWLRWISFLGPNRWPISRDGMTSSGSVGCWCRAG